MTRTPDRAGRAPSGPAAHGSAAPDADPAGVLSPSRAPAQTSPPAAPQLPAAGDPSPAGSATASPREANSAVPAGSTAIAAAMSEDRGPDSLDAHVRKLCRDLGLLRFHVHDSRRSPAGFPDLVIVGRRVLYRELKTERGKVSAEQERWLGALAAAGCDAGVWRPSRLLEGTIAAELAAISGLRIPGGTA